jgi:hypothetical protein
VYTVCTDPEWNLPGNGDSAQAAGVSIDALAATQGPPAALVGASARPAADDLYGLVR